jgi:NAD(P)-dependent dehydrogenase (short-subunit alcohol dehydrogenase family)
VLAGVQGVIDVEGKPVVLVTGGSRGIGRGISLALAREGFTVLVNYVSNLSAAEQTRELIEKHGGAAELCQGDVSLKEDRDLLLDFCMETLGRLDVLVNNAGIAPSKGWICGDRRRVTIGTDTNLKSAFFMSQAVARLMISQLENKTIPSAAIINVSSISAYTASINRGEYCISKAGLSMVTKLFAMRLAGQGIRVYEVRPGVVATDMLRGQREVHKLIAEGLTPIRRWGQPEDVGRAVAMLARGDLPFSTGEVAMWMGGPYEVVVVREVRSGAGRDEC